MKNKTSHEESVKYVTPLPSVPRIGQHAKKGYGRPQKRWDDICTTCRGSGLITGISGDEQFCPRCQS